MRSFEQTQFDSRLPHCLLLVTAFLARDVAVTASGSGGTGGGAEAGASQSDSGSSSVAAGVTGTGGDEAAPLAVLMSRAAELLAQRNGAGNSGGVGGSNSSVGRCGACGSTAGASEAGTGGRAGAGGGSGVQARCAATASSSRMRAAIKAMSPRAMDATQHAPSRAAGSARTLRTRIRYATAPALE